MSSTQDNISLVKRFYEEVYNKGNVSALDQFLAGNVTIHDLALPHQREGLKEYKETEQQYRKAFPNRQSKIDDIFASEDKVAVRWTLQATHKGDLKDISATNKSIKVTGISLYQIRNGKITEVHQQWDRLGLFEQIGEVQPALALH